MVDFGMIGFAKLFQDVEKVCEDLSSHGVEAVMYHAGLTPLKRKVPMFRPYRYMFL